MLAALSENWIFLFIVLVINNGNISYTGNPAGYAGRKPKRKSRTADL